MTLIEACKMAMEEIGRPATAKEIHDIIIEKNYFIFETKTPQASVSAALSNLTNPEKRDYDENITCDETDGLKHYYFLQNIEPEQGNTEESEGIREMFLKAKEVDIQMTQWPIFTLKFYLETNTIRFSADYQRLPDLWDKTKKSRLIESILLRLPLPAFYLDEKKDEKGSVYYEVVDGLQRISTFRHFFIGEESLKLQNLEYLGLELNGKTFKNLSPEHQNRILAFNITAYIIKDGCPPEIKYNLFKRINTGGLVLKDQEIRNALNSGKAVDFIKKLADLECFKRATSYAVPNKRSEDCDFVNRFVAFYLNREEYRPDMGSFLNAALLEIKKMPIEKLAKIEADFIQAMETAWAIFEKYAFRKRYNKEDTRKKPINKALFEALSVCLAQITPTEAKKLILAKEKLKDDFIPICNKDEFETAVSRATGDKQNVKIRYQMLTAIIKNALNDDN